MGILDIFKNFNNNKQLFREGKEQIRNKKYLEAIDTLTRVIDKNSNKYDALVARARAFCYLEEYDKAMLDLNAAVNINASATSALYYRGQIHLISCDLYEALSDFTKVISIDRRSFDAYLKRGATYSRLRLHDAAVNNFKAAVRIKTKETVYYDILINECFIARRYKEASKYSSKLVEIAKDSPRGYYYLGRVKCLEGKTEESIDLFTSAIRRDGNNVEYLYQRGMSYLSLGKYDEAIVDFTVGLNSFDINQEELYFSRGYSYLKLNEFEKAVDDFNEVIKFGANVEGVYYNKSVACLKLGRYKEAIEALNKLIEDEDEEQEQEVFASAYFDRAFCYKNIGEKDKAIADYKKAIELNPQHEAFYYELARFYFDINDFDNVIDILDKAEKNIEKWSYKTFSYTLKGDIYFNEKNNMNLAIENYTKAIEVGGSPYLYVQRGKSYKAIVDTDSSILDFKKAIEMEPKREDAYYALVLLYRELNNIEMVEATYKDLIEALGEDEHIYNHMGNFYLDKEDYDKAYNYFTLALNINNDFEESLYYRGYINYYNNKFEDAIKDLTRAIEVKSSSEAMLLRGRCYLEKKEYDNAINEFNYLIENEKDVLSSYYTYRGMALYFKGENEKAIEDYNMGIKIDPMSYELYVGRADALSKIKMYKDAIKDYKKASHINNRYKYASYYNIGCIYSDIHESEKAIYYFTKSINLEPKNKGAYFKRSKEFIIINNYEKAIDDIENVLDLDRGMEKVRETIFDVQEIVDILKDMSGREISEELRVRVLEILSLVGTLL